MASVGGVPAQEAAAETRSSLGRAVLVLTSGLAAGCCCRVGAYPQAALPLLLPLPLHCCCCC